MMHAAERDVAMLGPGITGAYVRKHRFGLNVRLTQLLSSSSVVISYRRLAIRVCILQKWGLQSYPILPHDLKEACGKGLKYVWVWIKERTV